MARDKLEMVQDEREIVSNGVDRERYNEVDLERYNEVDREIVRDTVKYIAAPAATCLPCKSCPTASDLWKPSESTICFSLACETHQDVRELLFP